MDLIVKILSIMCVAGFIEASPVHIERIEMCDPNKDYPIKWAKKMKEENGVQIVEEGSLTTSVDMDDNIMNNVKIFSWEDDKWRFLISKEDKLCKMIEDFTGDFASDMEKAAGLTKSCPYPKGHYTVKNYILDFSRFKYKNFPDGKVKLVSEYNDKKTGEQLGCIEAEFSLKRT
ncbi:unnamed protein product [Phaedon cochleariae]|uniref:Uncharacterized protein n=1 Tax=Phaedon cochleariae TaxID=80249 RepID=A0A9P0DSK4_PHACE|nr:unnamed protein product [Phaedon cochleariae]